MLSSLRSLSITTLFSLSLLFLFPPLLLTRMRSTGRGGRRTTWRQSVPGTRADSRRTRSRCGRRSWSVRTRRYDRKWASYGMTFPAARMLWPATWPNSESCKGPNTDNCRPLHTDCISYSPHFGQGTSSNILCLWS